MVMVIAEKEMDDSGGAPRPLHYVFRVANRDASYKFYTEILGMKVLRHEEFKEGCKATCNGPYDNMWSKTMIGYGSEDEHFVLELTYNYTVHSYELGNDFNGIHIESEDVLKRVETAKNAQKHEDGTFEVKDPDGHSFFISKGPTSSKCPVKKVTLNTADLHKTKEFWSRFGMNLDEADEEKCAFSYGDDRCKLEFRALKDGAKLERKTAFGRIAFATKSENLKIIEKIFKSVDEHFIQQPLVSLETPGKATVEVVILRDTNEHEICFVGDEGFRKLSQIEPNGDAAIKKAIEKDDSQNWIQQ